MPLKAIGPAGEVVTVRPPFGLAHEDVLYWAVRGIAGGAFCLALMTAFQVLTNWSRALPQGPTAGGAH